MTDQTAMNGRTQNGIFAPGNRAAAGRSSRAVELRKAFAEAITPEDIAAIATAMVTAAKARDIPAAKMVLDRCCGKADPQGDEITERNRENSIGQILERIKAKREATNVEV